MMFYFTSSMIHSVDLARYGVSRAKDLGIWSFCCAASKMSVFCLFDNNRTIDS